MGLLAELTAISLDVREEKNLLRYAVAPAPRRPNWRRFVQRGHHPALDA